MLQVSRIGGSLDRGLKIVERAAHKFAARRGWAVLVVLILALGARLAVLHIEPLPAPGVHDEFSYLLMADTFAQGRLTNPTHPMWIHFESMNINQKPTYCSMYYPAQGVFLAFGQVLLGHPFWGVWLSTGLMCAAICWALQGWMPPAWALLGGILAIMRFGVFSYWADSYWGGSVAAIGGALAFGALPRIKRHQRMRDALILGLGLAILANSRPYEGLIYSLPILAALAIFVFQQPTATRMRNVVLPLAAVLLITFAFIGYYFARTTGNPLKPPYVVNLTTYMPEPQFMFQKTQAPLAYHNIEMMKFYGGYHLSHALAAQQHPLGTFSWRIFEFWAFFVGPILSIPLFFLALILPYGMRISDLGKARFLLLLWVISFVALLLPVYYQPHYAAPLTCVTLALAIQALRRVRIWDRMGRKKGAWVVRAVLAACFCSFALVTWQLSTGVFSNGGTALAKLENVFLCFDLKPHNTERAQISRAVSQSPGRHLILVQYKPDHNLHQEWVYNDADINNAKIVWAREISPAEDKQLVNYFSDRKVWLLEADENPPRLTPYTAPVAAGAYDITERNRNDNARPQPSLSTKKRPQRDAANEL